MQTRATNNKENMKMTKTKKITLATVKSFIRKNEESLFIDLRSRFDGMTDCCESVRDGFQPAEKTTWAENNTLGISGAWFVKRSRDYFSAYDDGIYSGISVSNSCGHFVLATKDV